MREERRRKKNRSEGERIELTELQKTIKREIRKDIRRYEEEKIMDIIDDSGSTKKLKKALNRGQYLITRMRNEKGESTGRREDILEVTTRYYENLYGFKETESIKLTPKKGEFTMVMNEDKGIVRVEGKREDTVPSISESEINKAIRELKNNKAPGPDKIENEKIKMFEEALNSPIKKIFNKILETEEVPKQWKNTEIIIIYKKGNRQDPQNYRPISLSPSLSKLFTKIIKNRIYNSLDHNQPVEQARFRKNFSTIDHIHTINQIIEKANEYQIKINMLFIDYCKAFDTIKHEAIWEALENQGVQNKIINIIKNLYTDAKAYLKLDRKGREFKINRGVRQGDPLSPNLFNSVLEEVFRKTNWDKYGLVIDGKKLNNLRFADDVILISESSEEIQKMTEELRKASQKVGLEINKEKTKFMTNDPNAKIIIDERVHISGSVNFHGKENGERGGA